MRKYWYVLVVLLLLTALSGCGMIFDLIGGLDDDDDDGGTVVPTVPEDMWEPGDNSPDNATALFVDSPQLHTLHSSSDVDWFVISPNADSTIEIQIYPKSNGIGIPDIDFDVYDASGLEVDSASSTEPNSTESLTFDTTGLTGPFKIQVYPWDGIGDYNIWWWYY